MLGFIFAAKSRRSAQLEGSETYQAVALNLFETYQLQWRQQVLWVSLTDTAPEQAPVSVQQLAVRLQASEIRQVCVDPASGYEHIQVWAEACHQTGKAIFLRTPQSKLWANAQEPQPQQSAIAQLSTLLQMGLVGPLVGLVAIRLYLYSSEPVFARRWTVGDRGRLYPVWTFHTTATGQPSRRKRHTQQSFQQHIANKRQNSVRRRLYTLAIAKLPQLSQAMAGDMSGSKV